jgi:hypothetical protein
MQLCSSIRLDGTVPLLVRLGGKKSWLPDGQKKMLPVSGP